MILSILLACTPAPIHPQPVPDPGDTGQTETDPGADDTSDDPDPDPDINTEPVSVPFDDPMLQYVGRIQSTAQGAGLLWSGSALLFETDAPTVEVLLSDDTGSNYLAVVVDGGEPVVVGGTPGAYRITAATGLSRTTHRIELHKRTEIWEGSLWVQGVELPEGGSISAVEPPTLRLEFYGDSITSGYSVDCTCDEDLPRYKNHPETYAAIATRALGGQHHSISLSGVGLVKSWWDGSMPDYWDGLGYGDHAWDFSRWPADIVVINLGQNDYWLGVRAPLRPAYVAFAQQVRAQHPDAAIILALGSMDAAAAGSPLPDLLRAAVQDLNRSGDERVYGMIFDHAEGGHPVAAVHQQMADQLVAFIQETLPEVASR